ncbi:MAG: hypothetical protein CL930_16910 [Deltaproteobacteria bacterium]|nr:hypothetical protein [Deltaproteobacteria bacterium]
MRALLVVVDDDDDDALARARQRWSRSRCGAWLSCFYEEVDKNGVKVHVVVHYGGMVPGSVFMGKKR